MEFKVHRPSQAPERNQVDIGTEWNLKLLQRGRAEHGFCVDIGTEWNLKRGCCATVAVENTVDIGTEWNLKAASSSLYSSSGKLI